MKIAAECAESVAVTRERTVKRSLLAERGAVMTEYGLLLVLICIALIAAVTAIRTTLFATYLDADTELQEIMAEGTGSTP